MRLVPRWPWWPIFCVVLLVATTGGIPQAASGQLPEQSPLSVERGDAQPGEILVMAVSSQSLAVAMSRAGVSAGAGSSVGSIQRVRVPIGRERDRSAKLATEPGILAAAPNYIRRAAFIPTDTYFNQQGHLATISAPTAWDTTTGSAGISIAIIDSGVDATHPDLQSKIARTANLRSADPNSQSNCPVNLTARDDLGHGTHVAGLAAASSNNGVGVSGVSWQSPLFIAKVLDCQGIGTDLQIIAGIDWAIAQGARVINLSIGAPGQSDVLDAAITRAVTSGAIVVVASGNGGTSTPWYPAASPGAVSISATDSADRLASFSNYGDRIALAAPGRNILSTFPVDQSGWNVQPGYQIKDGTSMSSPIVAGGMALVWSAYPSYSPHRIIGIVEASADRHLNCPTFVTTCPYDAEGRNNYYGHGRINLQRAMTLVRSIDLQLIMRRSPL